MEVAKLFGCSCLGRRGAQKTVNEVLASAKKECEMDPLKKLGAQKEKLHCVHQLKNKLLWNTNETRCLGGFRFRPSVRHKSPLHVRLNIMVKIGVRIDLTCKF